MKIAFVGCGYVFDLYMSTKWAHPELEVCGVFDIDTVRVNTIGSGPTGLCTSLQNR